jgi:hypothetical protein
MQHLENGSWQGVETAGGCAREERYFKLLPRENCLIEAVVVDADKVSPERVDHILGSIRESRAASEGEVSWRAFGLSLVVPKGVRIAKCDSLPASVEFLFREPGEQPDELTFSRAGLVRHWMGGSMQDWWNRRWSDRSSRVERCLNVTHGPFDIYLEERHLRPVGAFSRLRPRRRLFSALWVDPQDGRLYRHSYQTVGIRRPIDFGKAGRLVCRDDLDTQTLIRKHLGG